MICENCIHKEVCGLEGYYDEALKFCAFKTEFIPMKSIDEIKAEIIDEADFAYADFDRYKEEVLGVEFDELPDDDFRYGLERAFEIINRKVKKYIE